ncbi:MAG: Type 1 glutamine amidotransferase-like domain-containing protein [Bdellovibrionota bacterium]
MSLVLYSGGHYLDNEALNRACFEASRKAVPRVTYIPSSSDYGPEDFRDFVTAFERIGPCEFAYFPIDIPFTQEMRTRALESDVIFLSGGNTFYFLRNLRRLGLLKDLRHAHAEGKVLAGLSAGAILLTPNIGTASFPKFDCDENFVGLRNFAALQLTPFEFFPHYAQSERYKKALMAASRKTKNPIYAAPDGCGLVVSNGDFRVVGSAHVFHKGHSFSIAKTSRRPRSTEGSVDIELTVT